jgi:hypothetical protein
LNVIESRYLFQSLVIPKVLVRATEGLLGSEPRVAAIPSASIDRLLQGWLRTEHLLMGWMPFGTSVLAVATH